MEQQLVFTEQELAGRLAAVRSEMAGRELDLCLISTPENIFYLTGLDHWGYFAAHVLMVPFEGEMTLVTRAMERVTIANQVRNARFAGHSDDETAADATIRAIGDWRQGRAGGHPGGAAPDLRIGVESWSAGLSHGMARSIVAGVAGADWVDITGLVDSLRLVKSAAEQGHVREAARISDAAISAAIDTIRVGATEREVAAECHRAMIEAGGTYPGFGPFIRPAARLGEEHTSWGDGAYGEGDIVFLEVAGCVHRYHAPMGRLVFLGEAPDSAREMARVCHDAFDAALDAMRPGALARDVYSAWQGVVDRAGLAHYRRHHCGYNVGIGVPPSWSGGNTVVGLRSDSDLEIRPGMTFHAMSWLMGTGRGDYFISNTVLLGESGPEVLTTAPSEIIER